MICTVHYKLYSLSNSTKFTYNQFIPDELIMMRYMILEFLRTIHIIIVRIFTHYNIRAGNYIFDKADTLNCLIRINRIWVWPVLHIYNLLIDLCFILYSD